MVIVERRSGGTRCGSILGQTDATGAGLLCPPGALDPPRACYELPDPPVAEDWDACRNNHHKIEPLQGLAARGSASTPNAQRETGRFFPNKVLIIWWSVSWLVKVRVVFSVDPTGVRVLPGRCGFFVEGAGAVAAGMPDGPVFSPFRGNVSKKIYGKL